MSCSAQDSQTLFRDFLSDNLALLFILGAVLYGVGWLVIKSAVEAALRELAHDAEGPFAPPCGL